MKMHLVMTAVFAVVCSQAAFAASEGGDTRSAAQPQAVARSPRPFTITTSAPSYSPQGFPVPSSEGGDTRSALQSQAPAGSTRSSTLLRDHPNYPSADGTPAVGTTRSDR